jgi:hypothetical protein
MDVPVRLALDEAALKVAAASSADGIYMWIFIPVLAVL